MRLFQRLIGFFKSNSYRELNFDENVEIQISNDITVKQSEETIVNDITEKKASLDQQILAASKKTSGSDDNFTSEDSVINIGERVPKGTNKTDIER